MDVGDGARRNEWDNGKRGGDRFGLAISKVAIAHICESEGFQSAQGSALDVLADVATRYMYNVGKSALLFANSSGRTECNLVDVLQALGDIGVATGGFAGASNLQRCVIGSGVIRDISYHLSSTEEIPFPRHVLNFPVPCGRRGFASFARSGETPPGGHIPNWLPKFPEPSTYVQNRGLVEIDEGASSLEVVKDEEVGRHWKISRSVVALRELLSGNDGDVAISLEEGGDLGEGREAAAEKRESALEGNPFLAPPLQFGEKEVSRLDFREGDIPSAIEAAGNGVLSIADGESRHLPTIRSRVHFRLHGGKRSSHSSVSMGMDVCSRSDVWGLENDEKNDKKQKNEQVHSDLIAKPPGYKNMQDGL